MRLALRVVLDPKASAGFAREKLIERSERRIDVDRRASGQLRCEDAAGLLHASTRRKISSVNRLALWSNAAAIDDMDVMKLGAIHHTLTSLERN